MVWTRHLTVLFLFVLLLGTSVAVGDDLSADQCSAGILKGGGPDCSGLLKSIGDSKYKVRVDSEGRPIAQEGGKARYVALMGCTSFHSRPVVMYRCWIEIIDVETNEKLRIGTQDEDEAFANPVDAMADATKDMNGGLTGSFNTKKAGPENP